MLEQSSEKIAHSYNYIAKEYSETFKDEHQKKKMDLEILHQFYHLAKNKTPILDIGCGPGHTTKLLTDMGLSIRGIDISAEMINQAKNNYCDLEFSIGNMLKLDLTNNSIGGVVSFYAIVHFSHNQVRECFREIFRVLKDNGIFLLAFHVGDHFIHIDEFLGKKTDIDFMFFKCEDIKSFLQEAGFKKIEMIEREPYPDIEYQSKRAYVFATKS